MSRHEPHSEGNIVLSSLLGSLLLYLLPYIVLLPFSPPPPSLCAFHLPPPPPFLHLSVAIDSMKQFLQATGNEHMLETLDTNNVWTLMEKEDTCPHAMLYLARCLVYIVPHMCFLNPKLYSHTRTNTCIYLQTRKTG